MIQDYFIIPWKEIRRRKLRSWLTLIGIVIGIAAVISLITLGQGLQNAISKQFAALGNDKLLISAKGSALNMGLSTDAVKLTDKDMDAIRQVSGVQKVAGLIYTSGRIEFNNQVRYFYVGGNPTVLDQQKLVDEVQNYKLLKGRRLQTGDTFKAVLGYDYLQKELFGQELEVGSKIVVQSQEFKVVGIYDRTGSPVDDKIVIIPLKTYQDLFNKSNEVGMIVAQVQVGEKADLVAEKIKKELRKYRHLKENKEDFTVETPQQLASTFSIILDIVQVVLIGIAAISLAVGGVGIMNTMYTSVLQRTKEIGVMKAMGARNSQIMYLFLVESGFYGLGGGLIGVLIGISMAKAAEYFLAMAIGPAFLSIELNWSLILGTLLFSFVVGCLSGLAPARKASRLNPVESLRYE